MKYEVTLKEKVYIVDVTESDAVILSSAAVTAPAAVAVPQQTPSSIPQPSAAPAVSGASAQGTKVVSPMPGNILKINVGNGQSVKAGEVLFILEAMKMENEIVAPANGTVKQILVTKGAVVDTDAVLAVI